MGEDLPWQAVHGEARSFYDFIVERVKLKDPHSDPRLRERADRLTPDEAERTIQVSRHIERMLLRRRAVLNGARRLYSFAGPPWQRYRLWRMNDASALEQNDVLAEILRTVHREDDADAQVRALHQVANQVRPQLTGRGVSGGTFCLAVNAARIRVRSGCPAQACGDLVCAGDRVPGGPDRPRTRPQRGVVCAVVVVVHSSSL